MAMGGGGSTYKSADGIWHAAIDIEPDRATGRRRRLTAQGKTKAVANARLRMKLDAYVRKGRNPAKMVRPVSASSSSLKVNPPSLPDDG